MGRAIDALESAAAKQRMIDAHASPCNLPELSRDDSRDKVATAFGTSGRTYEKAKAVAIQRMLEAAEKYAAKERMSVEGGKGWKLTAP